MNSFFSSFSFRLINFTRPICFNIWIWKYAYKLTGNLQPVQVKTPILQNVHHSRPRSLIIYFLFPSGTSNNGFSCSVGAGWNCWFSTGGFSTGSVIFWWRFGFTLIPPGACLKKSPVLSPVWVSMFGGRPWELGIISRSAAPVLGCPKLVVSALGVGGAPFGTVGTVLSARSKASWNPVGERDSGEDVGGRPANCCGSIIGWLDEPRMLVLHSFPLHPWQHERSWGQIPWYWLAFILASAEMNHKSWGTQTPVFLQYSLD